LLASKRALASSNTRRVLSPSERCSESVNEIPFAAFGTKKVSAIDVDRAGQPIDRVENRMNDIGRNGSASVSHRPLAPTASILFGVPPNTPPENGSKITRLRLIDRDCLAAAALNTRPLRGQNLLRGGRKGDRWPLRFGALFRRALLPTQIERAVDQTGVTIGLRKITQHATGQWIELFREQAHVIAARGVQPPWVVVRWAYGDCKIWRNDINGPWGPGWQAVAFTYPEAWAKMQALYGRRWCY